MGLTYTTSGLQGIQVPDDADSVANGAMRMRNMGTALDPPWTAFTLAAAWVANASYPPMYRIIAGMIFFRGACSTVATTWNGVGSAFATLPAAAPSTLSTLYLSRPVAFTLATNPGTGRLGWINPRSTGQIVLFAAATPDTAIQLTLDGVNWPVVTTPPPTP